jgi:hypothetical protein
MIMLPEFYQKHLKSQLSFADYILLKILITLLQSIKKVRLETLATVLPNLFLLINFGDLWLKR